MVKDIYFERALFLSWYCAKGDCAFCFMSTLKDKITDPLLARRTKASLLAEALLCRLFDWRIEFISLGYDSWRVEELTSMIEDINKVYGDKTWLNIGILDENRLKALRPHIKGVSAPVECVNWSLRRRICPSKDIKDIVEMLESCKRLRIKRAMTLILGLGETIDDFSNLKAFIKKQSIGQITFYRLKPQKDTIYEKASHITSEYYGDWVSRTRKAFPNIKIIIGSTDKFSEEITLLLESGADALTKFQSIKHFGSSSADRIVDAVERAGMRLRSNLNGCMDVDLDKALKRIDLKPALKVQIKAKAESYLKQMRKNIKR